MTDKILIDQLAPSGVLRAGINMSNFLLVTGKDEGGLPVGVSPDLARAIAQELGVELKLIPYDGPGDVADAVGAWDIANIAAEPERAKTISFSPAYCEIQATYLLPPESSIRSIEDIDKPGIKIVAIARAAYELWLSDNLRHATVIQTANQDESFDVFVREKHEVLAGLRPRLTKDHEALPGSHLLTESFTAVQQSIGCQPGKPEAERFLFDFVQRSIREGVVESLIEKHAVAGRLSVAPLQAITTQR